MAEIRAPLSVTIEITGRCDLDCVYCFAYPISKKDVPTPKILSIIDHLVNWGVWWVNISGGEPFLHPGIFNIINHLQKYTHKIDWCISSNGTYFCNEHVIKKFKNILENSSGHLQISIDSVDPQINEVTRGATKATLKGISNLISHGIYPTIGIVIHNQNIDHLVPTIDYLARLGLNNFHLMNLMHTVKSSINGSWEKLRLSGEKLNSFWRRLQDTLCQKYPQLMFDVPLEETFLIGKLHEAIRTPRCTAGWTQICINPNLKIQPCCEAPGIIMGDLNRNSFEEIWNSETAEDIRLTKENPCRTARKKALKLY